MGRHTTQKLLQDSFFEQLNSIQALEQLAPLHAARQHLPQDIVEILELLGKADNTPFNQLYNLVQDYADHYYTKVIKTLTVLVNTARTLKKLEDKDWEDGQFADADLIDHHNIKKESEYI